MTFSRTMAVGLLLVVGTLGAAAARTWDFVGGMGALRFVYVDPAHMKDTKLLATIVDAMYARFGKESPMEIDFFDDRAAVPKTIPFTAEQRRHQRAKFNFNPANGLQRFVWVELVPDPNDSARLRLKETEEKLPSP